METGFLAEEAERATAMAGGAVVGLLVAGDEAKDGGLAAAIGADEADALAVANDEGEAFEDIDGPERFAHVVSEKHKK